MATGQKITAQTPATSFDSTDLMTIVQSGANKSLTHDVLMDDSQICKAWMNYNHSTATLNDSFNVSSVTDNSVGNLTVNFTNNMSDVNYSTVATALATSTPSIIGTVDSSKSISSVQCIIHTNAGAGVDGTNISVQIFGS